MVAWCCLPLRTVMWPSLASAWMAERVARSLHPVREQSSFSVVKILPLSSAWRVSPSRVRRAVSVSVGASAAARWVASAVCCLCWLHCGFKVPRVAVALGR